MKKFILILFAFLNAKNVISNHVYYYNKTEKIILESNANNLLVFLKNSNLTEIKKLIENQYKLGSLSKVYYSSFVNYLDPSFLKSNNEYTVELQITNNQTSSQLISKIEQLDNVEYVSQSLSNSIAENFYFSNQIIANPNSSFNYNKLEELSISLGFKILGVKKYSGSYLLLRNKNSKYKSNELANQLYESGMYEYVIPDFYNLVQPTCVNDGLFGNQWHLNNTGQNSGNSGVDIKACNAWLTTTGSPNIKVAVIDDGFEMTHLDLISNVSGTGFDAATNTSPSVINGTRFHSTRCAGLISASSKNTIGVSGVSPNSKLVSVSIDFGGNTQQFADALDWAWDNGNVDIISNSWGASANVPDINDAIKRALDNGRNGKGCVVVFAAGNQNSSTGEFPSISDSRIICVGAIDRCGNRAGMNSTAGITTCEEWCSTSCSPGSSFGPSLDIVAAGSNTHTTDISGAGGVNTASGVLGDYISFGGTSAACPIVAGVAALVLSVNPCLTQAAVHDIICKSGQKVGTIAYNINVKPIELGSWNVELGHGLVDAEKAVKFAQEFYLQFDNINVVKDYKYRKFIAGKNVDPLIDIGDYNINIGGNVTLRANESIILKDGFTSKAGSIFYSKIEPINCDHSHPIFKVFNNNNNLTSSKYKNLNSNIKVYPNPTISEINLEYIVENNSNVIFDIFNLTGKLVYSQNFYKNKGNYKEKLDIFNSIENGIYILKLTINNFSESFKIIKNDEI